LESFERALKIDLSIRGEDDPKIAVRYNNIGKILSKII
jgi:hypothetical protein